MTIFLAGGVKTLPDLDLPELPTGQPGRAGQRGRAGRDPAVRDPGLHRDAGQRRCRDYRPHLNAHLRRSFGSASAILMKDPLERRPSPPISSGDQGHARTQPRSEFHVTGCGTGTCLARGAQRGRSRRDGHGHADARAAAGCHGGPRRSGRRGSQARSRTDTQARRDGVDLPGCGHVAWTRTTRRSRRASTTSPSSATTTSGPRPTCRTVCSRSPWPRCRTAASARPVTCSSR